MTENPKSKQHYETSYLLPFLFSVIRNGFEFTSLQGVPVVGDTVKLRARASVLKFTNITLINGTASSSGLTTFKRNTSTWNGAAGDSIQHWNSNRTTITYNK